MGKKVISFNSTIENFVNKEVDKVSKILNDNNVICREIVICLKINDKIIDKFELNDKITIEAGNAIGISIMYDGVAVNPDPINTGNMSSRDIINKIYALDVEILHECIKQNTYNPKIDMSQY